MVYMCLCSRALLFFFGSTFGSVFLVYFSSFLCLARNLGFVFLLILTYELEFFIFSDVGFILLALHNFLFVDTRARDLLSHKRVQR